MDNFWTDKQKQDIAFFNENVEKWVADPLLCRKFIVISDKEVKGFYDSFESALGKAVVSLRTGEFIIQQVLPKNGTVGFLSPALALT